MSDERQPAAPVQQGATELPDSIRVPLDSLHADALYLTSRVAQGTMSAVRLSQVIRERIDAAKAALQAAPQQWQSLTDGEWVNIVNSDEVKNEGSDVHGAVCVAFKMIEKRLREKNEFSHPAPGAGEQEAVAYLDIGAGGYLDIGSDLSDDDLLKLPKGRHMLGIIGTYGVDGYKAAAHPVEAQQAASENAPLSDFQEGQWWIAALDAMVKDAGTQDQKRAVAVVHHLLRASRAAATAPAGHDIPQLAEHITKFVIDGADTARLNWLDATNARFRMDWKATVAPAGNVSIRSIIRPVGKLTTIREAIDSVMPDALPEPQQVEITAPAVEVVTEDIERMAVNRYRPVPAGVIAYKVLAGDGDRSLFSGTKDECYIVARKLTEAFLDGAFSALALARKGGAK